MAIEPQAARAEQRAALSWSFGQSRQGPRNPVRQRMLFTERLALLLETGVSLHAALQTLQAQAEDPWLEGMLAKILGDVLEGKPFSQAIAKHPELFPTTYVNLIAASEKGGFMYKVLQQLVEMDEKQERLRSTLFGALSYPAFLIVFSIAVVVFVLVAVFPKFADMFASIRGQLPISTLFLMGASDVLRQYWPMIIAAIAVGSGLVVKWVKKPEGRAYLDRLKLRLPVVREIFIQVYVARMMRIMGVSLANGVSVIDTLAACREVVGNALFQSFVKHVETRVTQGEGVAKGFSETEFVPIMVRQMISTGEQTGNLANVMDKIADFYERELTKKVTVLSKLAEPIMLLVMGAVVGTIVSSLILPIFKLSRAVH